MFTLINIKERTSNTATVSYNVDSCPIGNSATGNQAFTVVTYNILQWTLIASVRAVAIREEEGKKFWFFIPVIDFSLLEFNALFQSLIGRACKQGIKSKKGEIQWRTEKNYFPYECRNIHFQSCLLHSIPTTPILERTKI